MIDFIKQIFRLRPGEARLVLALGLVLLISAAAGELSGIVSLSNFLEIGGVNGILWIWLADMLLLLLMTGLQSLFIDRFERLVILRWMTLLFAGVFALLRLLFVLQVPAWLTYGALFVFATQQLMMYPLFFWILANDVVALAQAKRLFPLIAGAGFAGSLLGTGFAALQPGLFARLHLGQESVLTLNIFNYLLAYGILRGSLRSSNIRERAQKSETVRETLLEGWSFVREVPAFRYLSLAILALTMVDVFVEFRFLAISAAVYAEPGTYQRFYSIYRLAFLVLAMLVQAFLSGRLIGKIGLKNIFFLLPGTSCLGALWMLIVPGLSSGIGGVLLYKIPAYTVDESARKAFQALVPEERRGRVSLFLDSYLYVGGGVIGVLVMQGILWATRTWTGIPYYYLSLPLAALAALLALWAITRLRAGYDQSLLNWRLKRRQRRASVLDRLGD